MLIWLRKLFTNFSRFFFLFCSCLGCCEIKSIFPTLKKALFIIYLLMVWHDTKRRIHRTTHIPLALYWLVELQKRPKVNVFLGLVTKVLSLMFFIFNTQLLAIGLEFILYHPWPWDIARVWLRNYRMEWIK